MLEIPQLPTRAFRWGRRAPQRRGSALGFDDSHDLPDEVTPHYDLGEELDIIDEERAAKTTGAGFYFLKGEGAQLEHALIQFMLDLHREQDYVDVFPPIPVKAPPCAAPASSPKFADDAYRLGGSNEEEYDDEDLWLCPTAEVPVTNMYANEILLDDDLPLKHQAYTPNFRRARPASTAPKRGASSASTSSTRSNSSTSSNPRRATTASRTSSRKPRKSSNNSASPTASSSSVPAT